MNNATRAVDPPEAVAIPNLEPEPLIDLSDEEQQQLAASMGAALDRVAAILDGPDIDDGEFFRALDESHPDRPNHAGYY